MTDRPVIPYGRQTVDEDDIAAVVEVLRSDFLTQGPAVVQFEEAVAERVQARFAVAFANGTAALHGACAVAGLGKGDRVATSALSFVASANCARYVGSEVEFVDIDPETLNLDTSSVREGLDGLVVKTSALLICVVPSKNADRFGTTGAPPVFSIWAAISTSR